MFMFTQMQRGMVLIGIGAIILLDTLRIVDFGFIFWIGLGAAMVLYGLMITGYYGKIMAMINKQTKSAPKKSDD